MSIIRIDISRGLKWGLLQWLQCSNTILINGDEGDNEALLSILWITSCFSWSTESPFLTLSPCLRLQKGQGNNQSLPSFSVSSGQALLCQNTGTDRLVLIAVAFVKQDFLHLVSVYNSIHIVSAGWLWYLFVCLFYLFNLPVFGPFFFNLSRWNVGSVHTWIAFKMNVLKLQESGICVPVCVCYECHVNYLSTDALCRCQTETFTLLTMLLCLMFYSL